MTNRATDLNRILLLLLCACLLLPLFPGAAAEEHLPCAAELSAGAVFYTGRDLKEAIEGIYDCPYRSECPVKDKLTQKRSNR